MQDRGISYRGMFEDNHSVMLLIDPDSGFIVDANPAACRFYGYDHQTLTTMNMTAVNLLSDVQVHREMTLAREEKRNCFHFSHRLADGTVRQVEVFSGPLKVDERTLLFSIIHDITGRKEAEEALRLSETRLREAEKIARLGHWEHDFFNNSLFWSDEIYAIFGLERENFIPTYESFLSRIHPEDREKVEQAYSNSLKTALPYDIDHRIILPDGTVKYVHEKCITYFTEHKKPLKSIGTVQDITEQRLVERERRQLEEQFRQAQKMESIGQLAGGVAHDFNNMLNVISGHAELALSQLQSTDPLHPSLTAILDATRRSADLTRQLLAFARQQPTSPQVLDLNAVVSETLKMLGRLIGENIELSWQPGPELYPVSIDPSQIDQLLANLVVNARDAINGMGRIGIKTENVSWDDQAASVDIDLEAGDYVQLSLKDTGCGMSMEIRERIFEPFFSTKKSNAGTGLGLSTVYGIVKQNHGAIRVKSTPGHGTTFVIYFPRYEGEPKSLQGQEKIQNQLIFGQGERILVVEDDRSLLPVSREMLQLLGYQVLTSDSPIEALELLRQPDIAVDLLLTDVIMPDISGKGLAEQAEGCRPGLPVLFMSGYTADVIGRHGVNAEDFLFLQKPFAIAELSRKIAEALLDKPGSAINKNKAKKGSDSPCR